METINNIANAASKAVFGEGAKQEPSTQEPRSGETGLGTPDSPYDKGNLDLVLIDMGQEPSSKQMASRETEPRPSFASDTLEIEGIPGPKPSTLPQISVSPEGQEQESEASGYLSSGDPNRNVSVASTQSSDPRRLQNIEEVRRAFTIGRAMQALGAPASAGTDGASDTRDATAVAATTSPADPTSASQPTDTTAAQGNNVPTSEPSAEETAAIKATKDSAEAALNKETEPTTADTGAAKTESAPQPIDAAKPDAVKEAKAATDSPKLESTAPSQTATAKDTPSKDSTKSKGSVRDKLRGIKGKLPFGKKKSEGSSGLSQG